MLHNIGSISLHKISHAIHSTIEMGEMKNTYTHVFISVVDWSRQNTIIYRFMCIHRYLLRNIHTHTHTHTNAQKYTRRHNRQIQTESGIEIERK